MECVIKKQKDCQTFHRQVAYDVTYFLSSVYLPTTQLALSMSLPQAQDQFNMGGEINLSQQTSICMHISDEYDR